MVIGVNQSGSSPPPPGTLWRQPPAAQADLFLRGSQYLQAVRAVAVRSAWIELPGDAPQRLEACRWIGAAIHRVNQQLWDLAQDCLESLRSGSRIELQIFAAPIAAYAALDGFCNYRLQPMTIVVDPSRTPPSHWNRLVAHEVAHAVARVPGHGPEFLAALTQLCIALDLPLPPAGVDAVSPLCAWPPYPVWAQGEEFWQGRADGIGCLGT